MTHKKIKQKFNRVLCMVCIFLMLISNLPLHSYADEVKEIGSVEELKGIQDGTGKYVLTQDIELPEDWDRISFNGELNGNGHTITVNGSPVFESLGGNSIVKNIMIKGSVEGDSDLGALGISLLGKVQNSLVNVEIKTSQSNLDYIGGFVSNIAGDNSHPLVFDNSVAIVRLVFSDLEDGQKEPSLSEYYFGAIAGYNGASAALRNIYWSGADNPIPYDNDPLESSRQFDSGDPDDLAALIDDLNSHLEEGYLQWELNQNELSFAKNSNDPKSLLKKKLSELIAKIDAIKEGVFEAEDVQNIKAAADKVRGLLTEEPLNENQIQEAIDTLQNMFDQLRRLPLQKDALASLVEQNKDLDKYQYKKSSFEEYTKALSIANKLLSALDVTQNELDQAKDRLEMAVAGLELRNRNGFDPSQQSEVISIREASQLKDLEDGKVYRLENDLKITDSQWLNEKEMNALLDGNGHTIVLSNIIFPLFDTIGENGIIQNLGVRTEGTPAFWGNGILANKNRGTIINSYVIASKKSTKNTSGVMIGQLDWGNIINSYAIGSFQNPRTVGGLVGVSTQGAISESYWDKTYSKAVISGEASLQGVQSFGLDEMKSKRVMDLLNKNRQAYHKAWGRNAKDYLPSHGEDHEYVNPDFQFVYPVRFTDVLNHQEVLEKKGTLTANAILGGRDAQIGQLELVGIDAQAKVEWRTSTHNSGKAQVGKENGKVYSHGEETIVVTAYQINAEEKTEVKIAEFDLTLKNPVIEDLQVFVSDEGKDSLTQSGNVAGKEYVFDGKVYKEILLKAKIQGQSDYIDVNENHFKYSNKDNNSALKISNNAFVFNEPGKATVEISLGNYNTEIDIESRYVPVKSIRPIGGTFVVHERNSMSQNFDFVPLTGTGTLLGKGPQVVIVEPANASYKDAWEISSADESIAKYIEYIIVSIVPYKSGTVELTATSKDPRLKEVISGKSTVTIVYKNPIKEVRLPDQVIRIKEEEEQPLNIEFIGAHPTEKHVSEPKIQWTYQGDGKVQIRTKKKYIDQGTDRGYVADNQYFVRGIQAGEVIATGVLADQTNRLEPITLRIQVGEQSGSADVNVDEKALMGLNAGHAFIDSHSQNKSYVFGDEWAIITRARGGKSFDEYSKQHYVESVDAAFAETNPSFKLNQKPTTIARVILGLGSLGMDAEKMDYPFIERLLNHDSIEDGSNEAIFALIALDSKPYNDTGYRWNREKLIQEILSYQDGAGGFSLIKNQSATIDITAMALQALAKYRNKPQVQQAIEKGLEYLKANRMATYGYDSSESTAQVLLALSTLNMDPLKKEHGFFHNSRLNIISALMQYYSESDKGFKHHTDDSDAQLFSTIQSTYALEAYQRLKQQKNTLYDFSDVKLGEPKKSSDPVIAKAKLLLLIVRANEILRDRSKYSNESTQRLIAARDRADAETKVTPPVLEALKREISALEDAISGLKPNVPSTGGGSSPSTIRVGFTLKGMKIGGHTEQDWIVRQEYQIPENSKVYDVFDKALREHSIDYRMRDEQAGGYIYSIQSPIEKEWLSEFTNGKYSGWMYTVNGVYVPYGLKQYTIKDRDEVIWHYTNDYRKVNSPERAGSGSVLGTAKENVVVDAHNIASIQLDERLQQTFDKEIEKAIQEKSNQVTLDLGTARSPKGIRITVDKAFLGKLDMGKDLGLQLKTDLLKIQLDSKAIALIKQVQKERNSEAVISIDHAKNVDDSMEKKARQNIKNIIGEYPVYDIKILINGEELSDYKNGKIGIAIPFETDDWEKARLTVYRIETNGKLVEMDDVRYKEQQVLFTTNHLSYYAIGKKEWTNKFTDVAPKAWYAEAIYSLHARGIVSGRKQDRFYPNANITRAEFVAILSNLSGNEKAGISEINPFSDVESQSWYYESVMWAKQNNIVGGYGQTFKPYKNITREEMASILQRYSEFNKDIRLVETNQIRFTDETAIGDWARKSVQTMANSGIIGGRENGKFVPKATATRAEAAQMIFRLLSEK